MKYFSVITELWISLYAAEFTVNITINSAARRSQALKRLRRYQFLIHVWIGRLSANIANISIGLTTIFNAVLNDPRIKEKFTVNFKEMSWNNYQFKYNVMRDSAIEVETSVIYTPNNQAINSMKIRSK